MGTAGNEHESMVKACLNARERRIEGLEALGPSMHKGGGLALEAEIRAAWARYQRDQRKTTVKAWWKHGSCEREAY